MVSLCYEIRTNQWATRSLRRTVLQFNFKGGGQECPSHTFRFGNGAGLGGGFVLTSNFGIGDH
jgi:hypothetical protein